MGDLAAAAVRGVLGVVDDLEKAMDLTRRGVPTCLKTLRSTFRMEPRKYVLFCI
jgi:hypothetical protein